MWGPFIITQIVSECDRIIEVLVEELSEII